MQQNNDKKLTHGAEHLRGEPAIGFWRAHRYFCCLHHWVSTASFASFHLHLTSTHRLCCQLRLVEFFELNGRVHTSTRDRPLGSALGVATFINQFSF
jgi:hypothetical protein